MADILLLEGSATDGLLLEGSATDRLLLEIPPITPVVQESLEIAAGTGSNRNLDLTTLGPWNANDLCIVEWYIESNGATLTLPDGTWNQKAVVTASDHRLFIAWKRMSGGESGNVTFSWGSATFHDGAAIRVSGARTTGDPWEAVDTDIAASGTVTTAVSLGAGTAERLLIFAAGTFNTSVEQWSMVQAGWTEWADVSDSMIASKDDPTGAATGSVTANHASASSTAFLGALLPVSTSAVELVPGVLSFLGVGTVPQPVVSLTPGSVAFAGVDTAPQPVVSLSPGSVAFQGVDLVPQQRRELTPGVLSFSGSDPEILPYPVIQHRRGSVAASTSVVTDTITTQANKTLVLIVGRTGGTGTGALTGVTDPVGNTWQVVTRGGVSGTSNTRLEVWYTTQNVGPLSGQAVTATSASSQASTWQILELDDVSVTGTVEAASPDNSGAATNTSHSTPAVSVTDPSWILSAINHPFDASQDVFANGFALKQQVSGTTFRTSVGIYEAPTASSYDGDWTLPASYPAGLITVAFQQPVSVPSVAVTPGVLAFSGAAAEVQPVVAVTPGVMSLSGVAATVQPILGLTPGNLAFVGQPATPQPRLAVTPGSLAFLGVAGVVQPRLTLTPGVLQLLGVPGTVQPRINVVPGALSFAGLAGVVQPRIGVVPGVLSLNGLGATVQPVVSLTPGVVQFGGVAPQLMIAGQVQLVPGVLNFSGLAAEVQPKIGLTPGVLNLAGVSGAVQPRIDMLPGTLTFSGVGTAVQPRIQLVPGSLAFQGQPFGIPVTVQLVPGVLEFQGQAANVFVGELVVISIEASLQDEWLRSWLQDELIRLERRGDTR